MAHATHRCSAKVSATGTSARTGFAKPKSVARRAEQEELEPPATPRQAETRPKAHSVVFNQGNRTDPAPTHNARHEATSPSRCGQTLKQRCSSTLEETRNKVHPVRTRPRVAHTAKHKSRIAPLGFSPTPFTRNARVEFGGNDLVNKCWKASERSFAMGEWGAAPVGRQDDCMPSVLGVGVGEFWRGWSTFEVRPSRLPQRAHIPAIRSLLSPPIALSSQTSGVY